MMKPSNNDVRATDLSGGRNEETGGGEHTPNGADLNDQGVEVTNVSFANMSIQALNEMMMGRPANFYENEEVDDDDEDGDEDDYDVQEIQLSPTSAARGSPVWMAPTAAAGAAVTKLRSSNRKTKIFFAVGTSVFLIMFGSGLGGIINTNKAVVSQANLVDDCVTTAPTTKSSKGPTSPSGKGGKSGSQPTRRRMDSLRGVYGNSESGPKKAYLMELRTGSAKYSGGEGEGEEDIMARNLSSKSKQPSTGKAAKSTYSPNSKGGKGSKCNTSRAPTTSGKGGKSGSGPPGTKSGKGTRAPTPRPTRRTANPVSQQPSISANPSTSPGPTQENFPSSRPSESAQPSLVPSRSEVPTPVGQTKPPISASPISQEFPGGEVPQCDDPDKDPCLCGECQSDGTCTFTGQAGDGRPNYLCFQPNGFTCNKGDVNAELTVSFSPNNGCSTLDPIPIDNEPTVCPGGWLFTKPDDCKQPFVNNYSLEAPCVYGGAEVIVHASCSEEIGLCYNYCGFLLAGFSILNQDPATWYYPPGKSCSTITPAGSCSSNFPTGSPTTFTCPAPSPSGGKAAPGTECVKVQGTYTCDNCCSEFHSECDKGNKVVCGLNNDPDNSDCN